MPQAAATDENPALAAPTPQPAQGMEVVIDNGDAGFRPKENWHILPLLFHKSAQMVGKDCYQARPGLGASAEVLPDLPAEPITTHYHPTPLKQATSGDLAARLALVDPVFVSVPMTATQQIFDDCQTFPHEGCGGTRAGWLAIVTHQTISLTYRVTDDYKLLAVEGADLALDPWLMGQDTPQLVFLRGSGGGLNYTVHASQDNTWHLLRPGGGSLPDSDMTLTRDQAAILRSLAPKYSTLHLQPAGGGTFTFYGLGLTVAPTDAGRQALLALGAALMAAPP